MYTKNKTGVVMVERAMEILNYMSSRERPVGISEIANDLSLPKATVFRILNSLEECNAVECLDHTGYRLGCQLIKLGRSASKDMHLVELCKPYIDRIAASVDENVNLAIEYEGAMLSIYSTSSSNSVLAAKTIPISPMYCSSIGKAALACYDNEALSAYFKRQDIRKRTNRTIVTKEEFLKERTKILETGFAVDDEEYEEGLYCVAVPVHNGDGTVIACISVSGNCTRMKGKLDQIKMLLEQVKEQLEVYGESMNGFVL